MGSESGYFLVNVKALCDAAAEMRPVGVEMAAGDVRLHHRQTLTGVCVGAAVFAAIAPRGLFRSQFSVLESGCNKGTCWATGDAEMLLYYRTNQSNVSQTSTNKQEEGELCEESIELITVRKTALPSRCQREMRFLCLVTFG